MNTVTSFSRDIALIFFSGLLFIFCAPGKPCPWLAWLVMAPLFLRLRQASVARGFFLAGLFGWLMWFVSTWWLYAPLHDMLGIPVAGAVLFIMAGCVLTGLPHAIAGAVVCKLPRKPGMAGAARDAATFTIAIVCLTPIFHGTIAHTQYRYPIVLQVLELGGAPLLLFLILWVNCLVADATYIFREKQNPRRPALAAIVIISSVILYGIIRLQLFEMKMESAPPARWFTMGAIQPNIPINVAADRQPDANARDNNFFTALQQAEKLVSEYPQVELLVLPENPETFLFNQDTARRQALGDLITKTHKPVMLNVDAFDPAKAGQSERYNVAVLMDANRNLAKSYAKIERVPFVEYIPGENKFPWLRKWFPKSQRVIEGSDVLIFPVKPGVNVIPLICYEGTFSSLTRRFVRKGGNVIVNQVNDSWFLRTPASEVHLALALFRTVEFRIPLVRVTNSGIGAYVQASGRIVPGSRTELFEKNESCFPLYVPPERSLYAVIGNWWMLGFVLLFFSKRSGLKRK